MTKVTPAPPPPPPPPVVYSWADYIGMGIFYSVVTACILILFAPNGVLQFIDRLRERKQ